MQDNKNTQQSYKSVWLWSDTLRYLKLLAAIAGTSIVAITDQMVKEKLAVMNNKVPFLTINLDGQSNNPSNDNDKIKEDDKNAHA